MGKAIGESPPPFFRNSEGILKVVVFFLLKAVIYCVNYLAQKIPAEFLEWKRLAKQVAANGRFILTVCSTARPPGTFDLRC